jgi:hypothetical protein
MTDFTERGGQALATAKREGKPRNSPNDADDTEKSARIRVICGNSCWLVNPVPAALF